MDTIHTIETDVKLNSQCNLTVGIIDYCTAAVEEYYGEVDVSNVFLTFWFLISAEL